MMQWHILGWVMIGAAVFVTGVSLFYSLRAQAANVVVLVGLMVPLALQVSFGIYLLRRGNNHPND